MSSLWARLDAAFAAAFLGEMGTGGTYPTLRLRDVAVNEQWNPDGGSYPRMILYSTVARVTQSEHGGGGMARLDLAYPYLAVGITSAETYEYARADAQELFSRMVQVLAQAGPILAAAKAADPASAEQARRVLFERGQGAAGIEIRARHGSERGPWVGLAIVAWTVETRTGASAGGA